MAAHTKAAHATQAKVHLTVFGTTSFGTFLVALLILAFVLMTALKYIKEGDADAGGPHLILEGARNPGSPRTPPQRIFP